MAQVREEGVRGHAGDHDEVGSGPGQGLQPRHHHGYGGIALSEEGGAAVRHLGIGVDHDAQVVLVAAGRSVGDDLLVEGERRLRTHAPQDPDDLLPGFRHPCLTIQDMIPYRDWGGTPVSTGMVPGSPRRRYRPTMEQRSASWATLILLLVSAAPALADGRVALTFDDLPIHSALPAGTTRADIARSIVATLRSAKAPATFGFVNAKGLQDYPETAEFLQIWRAAGHPLGNHAYSHMDLHKNTAAAYEQDILAGEPPIRAAMGEADWRWFRYPFLREGDTLEKRHAIAGFLKERGYRVAEVTLSFDDYAYNEPYARCLARGDTAGVDWLKESYLRRAADSLSEGQRGAREIYGRDIAHVMLLHVGAFQMVMLPRLMDLLKEKGLHAGDPPRGPGRSRLRDGLGRGHAGRSDPAGAHAQDPPDPAPSARRFLCQDRRGLSLKY